MPKLSMRIFAYHISCLSTDTGSFGLSPCEGVNAEVEIIPAGGDRFDDEVTLNGKSCGNRSGGIREFTKMVGAAAPEVVFD